MSPRLHVVMHTVAARQVLELAPPAAWRTLLRLLDEGYDLHEVMHMLASVVSDHMYAAIREGVVYDEAEHVAALDALPGDWEHERHRLAAQARSRHRRADHHRPRR